MRRPRAGAAPRDATARTFESFGYEWTTFDDVRDEDAGFADAYFRDLDFDALTGRVGLDAGCGKGRYTRFLAPHLARTVALDGSRAVEAAARNLEGIPNTFVVRGDLRSAPFPAQAFSFISCLGVLHHLEDPRQGLHRLVEMLRPGGILLVYVYSRPEALGVRRVALALATVLRRVTVRMPLAVLRRFSRLVATALSALVVRPGAWGARHGVGFLARLPMATYRDQPFRSLELDTFDRLSAPVEYRYVWADIEPWFAAEGLVVDAAREETGWFVLSHLPEPADGPG